MRVRERNEEDARGLQLERRNAEDAVAAAERAVFGAQQEFDDALAAKRNNNGNDDAVDSGRTKLVDARKKLEDRARQPCFGERQVRHAAADAP